MKIPPPTPSLPKGTTAPPTPPVARLPWSSLWLRSKVAKPTVPKPEPALLMPPPQPTPPAAPAAPLPPVAWLSANVLWETMGVAVARAPPAPTPSAAVWARPAVAADGLVVGHDIAGEGQAS